MMILIMIWSCWESPDFESPQLLSVLACERVAYEDAIVEEDMGSFVSVCGERPLEVEAVIARFG